ALPIDWSSRSTRSMRLARTSPTSRIPDASRATASITPRDSSRRARRLIARSGGLAAGVVGAQGVAEAADGPQQPRLHVVDLASQVAQVRLDDVGLAVEVVLPDVVQDLLLRQHAFRVEQEVAQQAELGRRQVDLAPRPPDLVPVLVHLEVAIAEHGRAVV